MFGQQSHQDCELQPIWIPTDLPIMVTWSNPQMYSEEQFDPLWCPNIHYPFVEVFVQGMLPGLSEIQMSRACKSSKQQQEKNSSLLPLLRRCAVPSYVAKVYQSREREGNGVQYVVGLGVGFNRSKTSSFSPTVMRPTLSSFPDTNASTPPASAICRYDDEPVPPVYKPSRNQFKSHCALRFGRDWLVCFTRKRSSSSQRREINDTNFFLKRPKAATISRAQKKDNEYLRTTSKDTFLNAEEKQL